MLSGIRVAGRLAGFFQSKRRSSRGVGRYLSARVSGPWGSLKVRGLDAGPAGMTLASSREFPIGVVVCVHLEDLNLVAPAAIESCQAGAKGEFIIEVTFRHPLRAEKVEAGGWSYQLIPYDTREIWDGNTEYLEDVPA